jgi:hypothetical protein
MKGLSISTYLSIIQQGDLGRSVDVLILCHLHDRPELSPKTMSQRVEQERGLASPIASYILVQMWKHLTACRSELYSHLQIGSD